MEKFTLTEKEVSLLIEKFGSYEEVLNFIKGEKILQNVRWKKIGRNVYFSLTSNGKSGEEWIDYFKVRGVRLGDYAKGVLRSLSFNSSSGVKNEVVVIPGNIWSCQGRRTGIIINQVKKDLGLKIPDPEIACLIRDRFSDEEIEAMDFEWIVVMHEPIKPLGGDEPFLLFVSKQKNTPALMAICDYPQDIWRDNCGFAFIV